VSVELGVVYDLTNELTNALGDKQKIQFFAHNTTTHISKVWALSLFVAARTS